MEPIKETEQQVMLSTADAMAELGITNLRHIQTLAADGKLERISLPRQRGKRGNPPSVYTRTSIEAYKRMREMKESMPIARAVVRQNMAVAAEPVQTAQLEAFSGLAKLCAALSAQLPALSPKAAAFAPGAFLSVAEAAAWKRRSRAWVIAQCESGRLPHERTSRRGYMILLRDLDALPAESAQIHAVKFNAA